MLIFALAFVYPISFDMYPCKIFANDVNSFKVYKQASVYNFTFFEYLAISYSQNKPQ